MISYNNAAPKAVNNVGQFGATEGSIGAYKSAAEYAADAKYWALLSQTKYSSVEDILAEVERLYAQGKLLEDDINQLKNDFEAQEQVLLGLIQSTGTAIDNTNAATELSREATQEVLAQLDIISNMTVQTALLPPGSMATGSYDNSTGVFSFGIPEGQPGRDGTDGTISDIGNVAVGVPVPDDYGFYVDKENGGLYRANMSDIVNLIPSIRSISINGGEEQTGAVSFNSVSSFNSRIGDVVSEVGDYSVEQITGAAKSGANSDITSLSGLTTALSVSQGGTGASTPEASRTNLGLGSVSVEDIVPLIKGGTGATTPSAARTNLGLGLVSTESIVPITKGGTGSTSAENARSALVAAKSGANSDITSMTNSVTFTQPVSVADAVDATNAVNLGQISSDRGASLIGTLEGVPVQNAISNINTDIVQLKLKWAIENGYSDAGFTFTTGGTLTVDDRNKVVYDPVSKTWYSYSGALPFIVPAAFNPVGNASWKPQTDPELRSDLARTGVLDGIAGDKQIGSSHSSGTIFDDYSVKTAVFPLTNIYPTMTNAEINRMLATGGSFYVNAGTYTVSSNTDTWKLGQNSRIYWSPGAILQAGANSVTLLRGSSKDVGSSFIRNCKIFDPRLSLVGFNSCIGLHCYDMRNNSEVSGLWMDMGLGTNGIGTLIEHYSFGIRFYDSEILNGGVGSTRIMLRNGVNSVTIKDHFGYSGDHTGPLPDYGIAIFNGMDGTFSFPEDSDLWPTAAVCITGGYSQNTSKYGLLDSGVSTYVAGTYFERNALSDVSLGNGSYYFSSKATHHSLDIGESCFRSQGAHHANIGAFNPADRSIGQFNFTGGENCHADGSKLWGNFLDKIGVVDGLRLDLGEGSIKQYTSATLPIKIREGFRSYRINVTSGMDITLTGTPYDGQQINMLVRGSNITSLSFAGVPVDVTGANTAGTKTASLTATYWASINKWTLSMTSWSASS